MSLHTQIAKATFLIVLVALAASSGCQTQSGSDPQGNSATTKQVTVDITGMT
jgi:hypothetical protein